MKIGKPKLIFNPYDWLPGYGESKVSFRSFGLDVVLTVEYDRDVPNAEGRDAVKKMRREITFRAVRFFMRTPFPGNLIFDFHGDPSEYGLGELTEFLDSELIGSSTDACRAVFSCRASEVRHFSIQFLSENVAFHVLAEAVSLSDEELVA
ncbi:hypothetical protein ACM1PE_30350 [Achromobacter sp. PD1]|uniref:hypothetical protein n=1 Tax=Achromobacter sp. PD1 TaxID=3399125 RepID=UPI003AF4C08E